MSFVRQALDYLRFGGDTDADPDDGPVDDYDDVDFVPPTEPRREAPVHRVRGTQPARRQHSVTRQP